MISGRRVLQTVCIFCLALSSASLLEFVSWGGFSSRIYPAVVLFIFTRSSFQHLGLSEKSWGFRSILGGSPFNFFFGVSRRRLQICRQIRCYFLCKLLGLCWPIYSGVSTLVAGLLFFDRSPGGVLVGSCSSLSSLWWQGLQISQIGFVCDCKQCPRNSSPCLLFFASSDREGLKDIFSPSLLRDSFVAIFTNSVRGG